MSLTEKPAQLVAISEAVDVLSASMPNGTAWVFAAVCKLDDEMKMATMFCTNQSDDGQAVSILSQALESKHHPDSVAETHTLTRQ